MNPCRERCGCKLRGRFIIRLSLALVVRSVRAAPPPILALVFESAFISRSAVHFLRPLCPFAANAVSASQPLNQPRCLCAGSSSERSPVVHVVRRFGICVHLCKSVAKDYRILSADWRRFSQIFFGVKSKLLNQPLLRASVVDNALPIWKLAMRQVLETCATPALRQKGAWPITLNDGGYGGALLERAFSPCGVLAFRNLGLWPQAGMRPRRWRRLSEAIPFAIAQI